MSGNVWEWCLNEYEKPKRFEVAGDESRVVRGGSWSNFSSGARAAYRFDDDPDDRDVDVGFRLCCASPIL
jgi:formylglycine-generating enzyme required for sulfatase activity